MGYILQDTAVEYESFFVNPSYQSWSFTMKKEEATVFASMEEAQEKADAVNRAVVVTYWDWSDIPPKAAVVELNE